MLFPVPVLLSCRIIQQILPLHCNDTLSYLQDNWVQAFFHSQPLGSWQTFNIHAPSSALGNRTVNNFVDVEFSFACVNSVHHLTESDQLTNYSAALSSEHSLCEPFDTCCMLYSIFTVKMNVVNSTMHGQYFTYEGERTFYSWQNCRSKMLSSLLSFQ